MRCPAAALPLLVAVLFSPARADENRARELARASTEAAEKDPVLSLLLARAALAAADIEESRTALYAALPGVRRTVVLEGHTLPVVAVDVAPDGSSLVTASRDGTARVWSARGDLRVVLTTDSPLRAVHFVDSAERVITESDEAIVLWSVGGERLAEFGPGSHEIVTGGVLVHPAEGPVLFVDPDGKTLREITADRVAPGAGAIAAWALGPGGRARLYDARGHEKSLRPSVAPTDIALASSGCLVATWGEGKVVELWTPDGKRVAALDHDAQVERAAVSSDGTRVVTAAADRQYRWWTGEGRKLRQKSMSGPSRFLQISDFTHRTFALDGTARIGVWCEDPEWSEVKQLPRAVRRIEVNRNCSGLFVEYEDDTTQHVVAGSMEPLKVENLVRGTIREHRWGHASAWEAVGGDQGTVAVQHWGHRGYARLGRQGCPVRALCFSPDDHAVLAGYEDGSARYFEVDPPDTPVLYQFRGGVSGLGFSPDDAHLVAFDWTGANFFDRSGRLLRSIDLGGDLSWWSVNERVILNVVGADHALLFDLEGDVVARLPHDQPVTGIGSGAREGRYASYALAEKTVRFWDARGKARGVLKHPCGVTSVDFFPDGGLATTGEDGFLRLWTSRGRMKAECRVPGKLWYCVVSPAGDRVATMPVEGATVRLYTAEGEEVRPLAGHEGPVNFVAFAPEGDLVLTGSEDKTARVWGADGQLKKVLTHDELVYSGMVLPQGLGVVTGCGDGLIRIWSRDGQLRARIRSDPFLVTRVDCTEDGKWLAAGGDDGTVKLWPLDRGDLLRLAGDRLPRDFTEEERARFAELLSDS